MSTLGNTTQIYKIPMKDNVKALTEIIPAYHATQNLETPKELHC